MTPGDFSTIRSKIERSSFLSVQEKSEWLSVFPHMTAEHIKELDRILSIRAPEQPVVSSPETVSRERKQDQAQIQTPGKLKQDGAFDSLSRSTDSGLRSPLQAPVGTMLESKPNVVRQAEKNAAEVSQLRGVTLEKMREADSVYTFLEDLMKKAAEIKRRTGVSTDALLEAFEQSPLYRVYLESGLNIMKKEEGPLTRSEFEAMADFRADLRKHLT